MFRPSLRTTLPASTPASPIKPLRRTTQDKTTLMGARGATPAFPSPPASHRSLLIQHAFVSSEKKKETLTKKIKPSQKKLYRKKMALVRLVLELIIMVDSQRINSCLSRRR